MITMVAAAGENNTLGQDNDLLWHLPDDFKHFKKLTLNHPIVMGRKTFDTFPKLLPNRTHIIITRQKNYKAPGCVIANSMEEALKLAKSAKGGKEKISIIGGGEIYKLGLPYAHQIELTRIHHRFKKGDAFFPDFDQNQWTLTRKIEHPIDDKHQYPFTYLTFVRK